MVQVPIINSLGWFHLPDSIQKAQSQHPVQFYTVAHSSSSSFSSSSLFQGVVYRIQKQNKCTQSWKWWLSARLSWQRVEWAVFKPSPPHRWWFLVSLLLDIFTSVGQERGAGGLETVKGTLPWSQVRLAHEITIISSCLSKYLSWLRYFWLLVGAFEAISFTLTV